MNDGDRQHGFGIELDVERFGLAARRDRYIHIAIRTEEDALSFHGRVFGHDLRSRRRNSEVHPFRHEFGSQAPFSEIVTRRRGPGFQNKITETIGVGVGRGRLADGHLAVHKSNRVLLGKVVDTRRQVWKDVRAVGSRGNGCCDRARQHNGHVGKPDFRRVLDSVIIDVGVDVTRDARCG